MARKTKVLDTNISLYGDMLKNAEALRAKYNVSNTHNQYACVCRCTSMADANRQMEQAGMHAKFTSAYSSDTSNKYSLEVTKNGGIFIKISKYQDPPVFVSVEELQKPFGEEINVCDFSKQEVESKNWADSEWIDAGVNPPEELKPVFACFRGADGKCKMIVTTRRDYNYWDGVGRTGDKVFWRPLPEPPKF